MVGVLIRIMLCYNKSNRPTFLAIGTSYVCQCPEDFFGFHCELSLSLLNACDSNPCLHGGSCQINNSLMVVATDAKKYSCSCPYPWGGEFCEVDFCDSSPDKLVPPGCDDEDVCTIDSCSAGTCSHTPIPGCCVAVKLSFHFSSYVS